LCQRAVMALIARKSDEQKADEAAAKARRQADDQERRRLAEIDKAREAFFRTPGGQARHAFERADHVFQYSIDVMNQQAIIIAMVGSTTTRKTRDPVAILNSVCHEGWELVNGSFVFVEQGQQSRDKFLSSGQNIAVKGAVIGYYLFKRCEANRRSLSNPWESAAAAAPADVASHRECPSCKEPMRRDATVCPHCHSAAEPWRLIAGEWWQKRADGFAVLDEATGEWLLADEPSATSDGPNPSAEQD
jgi:hypothetical protein